MFNADFHGVVFPSFLFYFLNFNGIFIKIKKNRDHRSKFNLTQYFTRQKYKIVGDIIYNFFPKLPLLGYRIQLRRRPGAPPPPPPVPLPAAALFNSSRHGRAVIARKTCLRNQIPARRNGEAGRLHEGGAGFDGQCGHLLREERVVEAGQG